MGNTSLAILPDKQQLAEVNNRIKVMLPGGSKLSNEERFALAQIAVAHQLDPFNGEVWYIPGRGPMIGIKGLRKKAREQVHGNFWIDFREIMDEAERKRYGIEAGALAFEARIFDSENIRTYCEMVERMTKAGIPWDSVRGMMGDHPYTSGIGVLRPNEQTKMERVQCARKRAEADALKRRFDIPFGLNVEADTEPDAIDGEWKIEGSAVESHDERPANEIFREQAKNIGATDSEVNQALDDAGGDYETAADYLTKRVAARKLQNGKKAMGRDDSGLA